MAVAQGAHERRLDERAEPGWAALSESLFRYGGVAVGLLILWLGFLTGGFFLPLTVVLAAIAAVGGWLLANLVARESWYLRPNAKPITTFILVALPVLFIGFAQFAGPLLTPPPSVNQQFSGQLQPGLEQVHVIAVDPRLSGMSLTVSVTPVDGSVVRWFIQDPVGQSRWSYRTDQLGNTASKVLTPMPGQWTLHVIDDTGSAGYSATWQGWFPGGPTPPPLP